RSERYGSSVRARTLPAFALASQCFRYFASGSFEGSATTPTSFWRSIRFAQESASFFVEKVRVRYLRLPVSGSRPMKTRTRHRVPASAVSIFRTLAIPTPHHGRVKPLDSYEKYPEKSGVTS